MNRRLILMAVGLAALFILIIGGFWIGAIGIPQKLAGTQGKVQKRREVTEHDMDTSKLSRDDLPLLVAVVTEGKLSQQFRIKALEAIMALGPDDDQIDSLGSYVKRTLPKYKFGDDEVCYRIGYAFAHLFSETKNDRLLQAHRLLFKAPECGPACRDDILFLLRETGAKGNVPFFIEILNDPKAIETEKESAAYGLGVAGSDYAMQLLITMASYLFDREIKRSHLVLVMMSLHALQILAANRNENANRAIQELAERCCKYRPSKYPYKEYWGMPFDALAEIGGDENRAFVESLSLEKCPNSGIKQTIINTLARWPSR